MPREFARCGRPRTGVRRCGALGLLFALAEGARPNGEQALLASPEPAAALAELSGRGAARGGRRRPICGGPEIAEMLGLGDIPKVDYLSIKSIPWSSIMRQADGFIEAQNGELRRLQRALAQYAALLPGLRLDGLDSKAPLSTEALEKVMTDVLTESFGGVRGAADCGCGVRAEGDVAGYQVAEEAFAAAVSKQLQGRQFIGRYDVEKACKLLLQVDAQHVATPRDTACGELCGAFGAAAEAASREPLAGFRADGGPSFDEVAAKMKVIHEKLIGRQHEVLECEQDRAMLMEFGAKMHKFKVDMDAQFGRERRALVELRRVQLDMQAASKALAAQSARTAQIAALLGATQGEAAGLREAIDRLATQEQRLALEAERVQQSLKALQEQVAAAGEAVRAIREFKTALEVVMHDLAQVYEATIREPLRQLGVDKVLLSLERSRWSDVGCLERRARALVGDHERALRSSCAEVVDTSSRVQCMGKFAMQTETLNQTCRHYEAQGDEYIRDIVEIIRARQRHVAEVLNKLRCQSDPYTCAGVNEELEKAKIGAGEPAYLLRVRSLYKDSLFYKEYAGRWQLSEQGRGPLLALGDRLEALYRLLLKEEDSSRSGFATLIKAHTQALSEKQQLNVQLTKTLATQRCEELKTLEGQQAMQEFQIQLEQLKSMQDLFNSTAAAAMRAFEASKEHMRTEFVDSSFVKHVDSGAGVKPVVDVDVPPDEASRALEGLNQLLLTVTVNPSGQGVNFPVINMNASDGITNTSVPGGPMASVDDSVLRFMGGDLGALGLAPALREPRPSGLLDQGREAQEAAEDPSMKPFHPAQFAATVDALAAQAQGLGGHASPRTAAVAPGREPQGLAASLEPAASGPGDRLRNISEILSELNQASS